MGYDYNSVQVECLQRALDNYITRESGRLYKHFKYRHLKEIHWDITEKISKDNITRKDIIDSYFEGFAHLRVPIEFRIYYKELGYKSQSCMIKDIQAKIVADAAYGMLHYIQKWI